MKLKTIFSNLPLRSILFVFAGLILGWLIFHKPQGESGNNVRTVQENHHTIWTCAMHPQIRMDDPGQCPICGMDLIPLEQQIADINPDAIVMTEDALKLAEVQTTIVRTERPVKKLRLYGKVQADERLIQTQAAHFPGRIEKLLVSFTGEEVRKGQLIAQIYSPALITAQEELLLAVKMEEVQPLIYNAAKEKLRQWKLTENQISDIENSGAVKEIFDIYATASGTVTRRIVNTGDYVSQGSPLFEIADLSNVWVLFDAYESDLPWIRKGDKITFTLQAEPGSEYSGNVLFIDPVISQKTRVARVRIELANPGNNLKPEMFVTGTLEAGLSTYGNSLIIPGSAVLWTGKRSVVWQKLTGTEEPSFVMKEVTLGPALSDGYIVTEGIKEGDEIVTNGVFSVDAAAQLSGKPSMMNLPGDMTPARSRDSLVNYSSSNNLLHSSFHVSGNCEMCKDRIEKAASAVPGVSDASWDIETNEMELNYDKSRTDLLSIQSAIAAVGHDTELVRADDSVYNALPECCLYRK